MATSPGASDIVGRRPVLLLGASGFLGRSISAELERTDHTVIGTRSSTLDLRRPESVDTLRRVVDPETVLIMAAAIMRDHEEALEAFKDHIAMITCVARLLSEIAIRKCLYLSSAAVYGDHVTNEAITEETPTHPNTPYAMAKLAGELLIRQAAASSRTPVVILRACRVYGPGDPHVLAYGPARFLKTALESHTIELVGAGEERRDYIFVADAARAVRRFAENDLTGVYNLASGHSQSFAALADIIQRLMSDPVRVLHGARSRPVTHQAFVLDKLRRASPDFSWTPLDDGFAMTVREVCAQVAGGMR